MKQVYLNKNLRREKYFKICIIIVTMGGLNLQRQRKNADKLLFRYRFEKKLITSKKIKPFCLEK